MAVTVTNIATGTDTTASSVSSGAFTCTAGSMLVVIGYCYDADSASFATPTGFTASFGKTAISPVDSKIHAVKVFYKIADGSETEVVLGAGITADYVLVGVLEVAGVGTAALVDMDSASGSASPIVHPAMDAGEAAIRVVLFCGAYNASQVDVPTYFSSIAPDNVGTSNAIRTSYRITTNDIGVFSDVANGRWATVGLVVGSTPAAAGAAGVMFGADW